MASLIGGPLVARGSLATWELEYRARLAAAEEEAEAARMHAELRTELETVQAQLAAALHEKEALRQSFGAAQKALRDLRASRVYQFMRQLGRWASIDRDIGRVVGQG